MNNIVKKVFLHVGLHKTGTSSIQHTLLNNRTLLEENGVYFPKTWKHNHGLVLETMFSDEKTWLSKTKNIYYIKVGLNSYSLIKQYVVKNQKNFESEINNIKCETVVFSGEAVNEMEERNLDILRNGIKKWFPNANIYIIIYVRERSAYITSYFQQEIKGGKNVQPDIFENLFKNSIEKFINVFSKENIIVLQYEKSIQSSNGLVGDFLQTIGANNHTIDSINYKFANSGISAKALELVKYVNQNLPTLDNNNFRKGRQNRDTHHFHKIRGDKFHFDKPFLENIINRGISDNEWLWKNFNIDYLNVSAINLPQKNKLIYDSDYYKDLIQCYPNLTIVLQKLVYEFLLNKQKENLTDENLKTIQNLINWIDNQFPNISKTSLKKTITHFERNKKLSRIKRKIKHILNI